MLSFQCVRFSQNGLTLIHLASARGDLSVLKFVHERLYQDLKNKIAGAHLPVVPRSPPRCRSVFFVVQLSRPLLPPCIWLQTPPACPSSRNRAGHTAFAEQAIQLLQSTAKKTSSSRSVTACYCVDASFDDASLSLVCFFCSAAASVLAAGLWTSSSSPATFVAAARSSYLTPLLQGPTSSDKKPRSPQHSPSVLAPAACPFEAALMSIVLAADQD